MLLVDADPQGSVSQWFKTAAARGDRPTNIDVARAASEAELATLLAEPSTHHDRIIDVPGVADKSLIVAANAADLVVIPAGSAPSTPRKPSGRRPRLGPSPRPRGAPWPPIVW